MYLLLLILLTEQVLKGKIGNLSVTLKFYCHNERSVKHFFKEKSYRRDNTKI